MKPSELAKKKREKEGVQEYQRNTYTPPEGFYEKYRAATQKQDDWRQAAIERLTPKALTPPTQAGPTYLEKLAENREKAKQLSARVPETATAAGNIREMIFGKPIEAVTVNPRISAADVSTRYDSMTDREKAAYAYLKNTDAKKADEYLKAIEMDINARNAEKRVADAKKIAEESTAAGLYERFMGNNIVSNGAATAYELWQGLRNQPVDPNHPLLAGQDIVKGQNEAFVGDSTGIERYLREGAMGAFDFGTNLMTAGAVGLRGQALQNMVKGSFAAQAFAGSAHDAAEREGTGMQSVMTGAASAALATIIEGIGLDRLAEIGKLANARGVLKSMAKSILPEAAEEAVEEAGNILADAVIMGDKNEIVGLYNAARANGATQNDAMMGALGQAGKQIGESAIIGGISGGLIGGGVAMTNRALGGNVLENDVPDTNVGETEQLNTATEQANRTTVQNPVAGHETAISDELTNSSAEMKTQPTEAQTKQARDRDSYLDKYYHENGANILRAEAEKRGSLKDAEDIYRPYYTAGLTGQASDSVKGAMAVNADKSIAMKMYQAGVNDKAADMTARIKGQDKLRRSKTGVNLMTEAITDQQKALANLVAKVGRMNVTIVDTLGKNGKVGNNGEYTRGTNEVVIALDAESFSGTLFHETVHYIKQANAKGYERMAEAVFRMAAETDGVSVSDYLRRYESMEAYGPAIEAGAYNFADVTEELVADAFQMLAADEARCRSLIAELKQSDHTILEQIKEFLQKMLETLEGLVKDGRFHAFAEDINKDIENTKKLQKIFAEELRVAGENMGTETKVQNEAVLERVGVQIDTETESAAPKMSLRTWKKSDYAKDKKKAAQALAKAMKIEVAKAEKWIDDINSVAKIIANDRERLDYEENLDDSATTLKPNSDYVWTLDMSTLCAKRLWYTGTFDAIQRAMPNTAFNSEEITRIRTMMMEKGYEVACGICYVESTRREIGPITQKFIERYKEAQRTGNPISRINSSGKEVELTQKGNKEKRFYPEKGYTPTLADLNTTDIDLVKRDHPEVYAAYLSFMNARGQSKPKLLETRAEYRGEIAETFKTAKSIDDRNAAGGLRVQSFSDFEVPHMIDMMQAVMDMAKVGLKAQAYTKVPEFAAVFGGTGMKINLSLIAKGDGVDSGGRLIFDDVEGIDHKKAFKLREQYSENVGTILVGKNDRHIITAMADPKIDFIIPFHKSQWREDLYDALGLTGYEDYTATQNEKLIADPKKKIANIAPSEYWDYSKSGDENAQIYLEKCRKEGRTPKFPQFAHYPGYWKLLIDFKMYDNDGVGSPQMEVQPEFNMKEARKILKAYEGGHRSFPVAQDVVDEFVAEKQGEGFYGDNKKYSVRVTDKKTLDFLNGQETIKTYKTMQIIDGELHPPMAALVNGKYEDGSVLGEWEQAVEHPELVKKDGNFDLKKGTVPGNTPALYAPYMHSSNYVLNDQFSAAYKRPNLVVVECEVPVSELTSGYQAELSKKKVGWTDWHKGPVAGKLRTAKGFNRQVFLSRWIKPIRIIPDAEVAQMYKGYLEGTDIAVPDNVVSPNLLAELKKAGVPIEESGKVKYSVREKDVEYMAAVKSGDMVAAQKMVDAAAEEAGYTIRGNHGTLKYFTIFDRSYGNAEGDWGKGFYFSSNLDDSETNYASSDGADLQVKIERYAEQLEWQDEYEDLDYEERLEIARKELASGDPRIIEAYLRMENPVVIGGDEETYFDLEYEYDEEYDEYGEPEGLLVDFCQALESVLEDYEWANVNAYEIMDDMDGYTASQLEKRAKELVADVEDDEGNLASNEIVRAAFEEMGFDGIIDNTVAGKFGNRSGRRNAMAGVYEDTTHYIVFGSEQIKQADPVTYDNEGNIIPLSERFNPEKKDIRWSVRESGEAELRRENASLISENKHLQKLNENLKKQFKLTDGKTPDPKAVKRVAKAWLKQIQSKADVDDFSMKLGKITEYFAKAEDKNDHDHAMAALRVLVREAMEEAETLNTEMRDNYSDLISRIKNTTLRVTGAVREELEYYGGYNSFRRERFGSMTLNSQKGTSVDSFYNELCSDYPEFFKEEDATSEGEQLMRISEVLDTLKPVAENPYGYYIDEYVYDETMGLLDKMADIQMEQTFADKKKSEKTAAMQKLKAEFRTTMDAMRNEVKTAQEEAEKAYVAGRMVEGRNKAKEIARLEAKHLRLKERNKKVADNRKARADRRIIEKEAKTMLEWLANPTDTKHVPEALKKHTAYLLTMFTTGKDDRLTNLQLVVSKLAGEYKKLNPDLEENKDMEGRYIEYDDNLTLIAEALEESLEKRTDGLISLNNLTAEEMGDLKDMIRMLKKTLMEANKLVTMDKRVEVANVSEDIIADMQPRKNAVQTGKLRVLNDFFKLDMLDANSFFKRMSNTAYATIYRSFRKGLDTKIRCVKEAADFMSELVDKKTVKQWRDTAPEKIELMGGAVYLNTPQIMSVYCLSRREQGKQHLYTGGVVGDTDYQKKRLSKETLEAMRQVTGSQLTEADVKRITDRLTAEQKHVAREMQKFLSENAAKWGNDVTMQLFGYKKFNEQNYFPIKVDGDTTMVTVGKPKDATRSLRSLGMTKQLKKNAQNPVMARDIFTVFAEHIDQMSSYAAFVPAISDTNKILNYKTEGGASVKKELRRVMGDGGIGYIHKLVDMINGAVAYSNDGAFAKAMVRNMKIASVGFNARVVAQQPTSIVRASMVIDPKYIAASVIPTKKDWENIYRYAPISWWKEQGYYDVNIGKSIEGLMSGSTGMEKVTDAAMWAAGKADKFTWGWMWKAAEKQIRAEQPGLTGDAFYEAVGELFSRAIDETQVVDSPLHRSQKMREKGLFTQMTTSFMSEPTKTYNMATTAMMNLMRENTPENRKQFARTLWWLTASAAATAAAAAVIDAGRDDDDDEKWADKWLAAFRGDYSEAETKWDMAKAFFGSNFGSNVNPMNYTPYMKDLMSIFDGYDIRRTDMDWAVDIKNAMNRLHKYAEGDSEYTAYATFTYVAGAFSKVFGVPMKSIMRDMEALVNWANIHLIGTEEAKYENSRRNLAVGSKKNMSYYTERYLKAYQNGDKALAQKIYNDMINGGVDEEELKQKIASNVSDMMFDAHVMGNDSEFRKFWNEQNGRGKEDSSLRTSMRSRYETMYKNAVKNGDSEAQREAKAGFMEFGGKETTLDKYR